MEVNIHSSWKTQLEEEFNKPYFKDLTSFVKDEYSKHQCFPPGKQIFAAFDWCPFDNLKVVIIGQDPYHGVGQANGLCFSVNDGISHPPSGNLERWAKQGVLLLNATLTVRAHNAGSHQKRGWETFTDAVIQSISDKKENVVFLLWGGFAKQKTKLIDTSKHHVLTTGHPSPLSANRGYWFGNKHFSKTNAILKDTGQQPINW